MHHRTCRWVFVEPKCLQNRCALLRCEARNLNQECHCHRSPPCHYTLTITHEMDYVSTVYAWYGNEMDDQVEEYLLCSKCTPRVNDKEGKDKAAGDPKPPEFYAIQMLVDINFSRI